MILTRWMRLAVLPAIFFSFINLQGQEQTVGIFLNTPASFDGYTLLASKIDRNGTYLLDNCGRVVHQWPVLEHSVNAAFLLDDGSLMRLTTVENPFIPTEWGRVEKLNWQGELLWEYTYSDSTHKLHHDIEVLPNGNVLLLAYERKVGEEVISRGRKLSDTDSSELWVEHIIEVQPEGKSGGKIVWEWHVFDHLVQHYDSTKENYAVIADHPELVDVNYPYKHIYGKSDWLHANSIAYNAKLDQIVLSIRTFSEFWIIDHSTSTREAASHKGGRAGMGGDILYRWGNPEAYGHGDSSNQLLFFQHDVDWIPKGYPGEGNILVFNNGYGRHDGNFYSAVVEIVPPLYKKVKYRKEKDKPFGPEKFHWEYKADTPSNFYSPNISGARRLPNGNTVILEGSKGTFFEVDTQDRIVWKYVSPIKFGFPVVQGETPFPNPVFRVYRYGSDHPAFKGRVLAPRGYLEQQPWQYPCELFPVKAKKKN